MYISSNLVLQAKKKHVFLVGCVICDGDSFFFWVYLMVAHHELKENNFFSLRFKILTLLFIQINIVCVFYYYFVFFF